jgi:hypothetical protein
MGTSKDSLLEEIEKLESRNIELTNQIEDLELRLQGKQIADRKDIQNIVISVKQDRGITYGHRRDKLFRRQFSLVYKDGDRYREGIIARFYSGTSSTCCLWINYGDTWRSGSGKAAGGGYHKDSASFSYALECAGIELKDDVACRGDEAVVEAMYAISSYYGIQDCVVIKAHS